MKIEIREKTQETIKSLVDQVNILNKDYKSKLSSINIQINSTIKLVVEEEGHKMENFLINISEDLKELTLTERPPLPTEEPENSTKEDKTSSD